MEGPRSVISQHSPRTTICEFNGTGVTVVFPLFHPNTRGCSSAYRMPLRRLTTWQVGGQHGEPTCCALRGADRSEKGNRWHYPSRCGRGQGGAISRVRNAIQRNPSSALTLGGPISSSPAQQGRHGQHRRDRGAPQALAGPWPLKARQITLTFRAGPGRPAEARPRGHAEQGKDKAALQALGADCSARGGRANSAQPPRSRFRGWSVGRSPFARDSPTHPRRGTSRTRGKKGQEQGKRAQSSVQTNPRQP